MLAYACLPSPVTIPAEVSIAHAFSPFLSSLSLTPPPPRSLLPSSFSQTRGVASGFVDLADLPAKTKVSGYMTLGMHGRACSPSVALSLPPSLSPLVLSLSPSFSLALTDSWQRLRRATI